MVYSLESLAKPKLLLDFLPHEVYSLQNPQSSLPWHSAITTSFNVHLHFFMLLPRNMFIGSLPASQYFMDPGKVLTNQYTLPYPTFLPSPS